jgi:hypothetical protein
MASNNALAVSNSMTSDNTNNTASSSNESSLSYAVKSTLTQLKEQVEKVSAANARTEEKLQTLIKCLDEANVSLLSLCCCCVHYNPTTHI